MQNVKNTVEVTRNSFEDEGEGIVSFPNGLTISDNQMQRNGTTYDIDTLDISKYGGQLTADHKDELRNIIGRVEGVRKDNGRVTVNRIVYAVKQNPYARLAYDLLVGGFSKAFSTETIGMVNTADGILRNHELVGLSQVVTPNNYAAVINTVRNALQVAKNDGLNVDGIEDEILNGNLTEEPKMDDELKKEEVEEVVEVAEEAPERPEEAVVINEAVAEEAAEEVEAEAEEVVEEAEPEAEKAEEVEEAEEVTENEVKEVVENEISDEQVQALFEKIDALTELVKGKEEEVPEEPKEPAAEGVAEVVVDEFHNEAEQEETVKENEMNADEIKNAVADVLKNYFAEQAAAPEFKKAENSIADLDWKERYNKQVNAAFEALSLGNIDARKTLNEINEINLNALKEAGIAKNTMTIASMGNFVIPPEMYREMVGRRTDYSAILDATTWRETDSLEFAWLRRNGDIDMKNVAMCTSETAPDGNLKPISEYTATPVTSKLEELAAVTVICNAATRFFAVDLLADVAAGYRNDYDRKRAQLVIARLEQAVDETGYDVVYAPTTDTEAMVKWLEAIAEISDTTTNGKLIFNNKTFAILKAHALEAGVQGPLSHIFTDGEQPMIFGTPYIIVPNDLMPSIEGQAEVIKHKVYGEDVEINHPVFYADLGEFIGYTSGGLQYDVSADASYEVAGVVKSAYQRNELVLRGSFFRGGAIKDIKRVSGIKTEAES